VTLAVLTGVVGAPSETFVHRHVATLAPGDTVVVGRRLHPEPAWSVDGPLLLLDPLADEWAGPQEQAALAAFLGEHRVDAVLAEFLDLWPSFIPTVRHAGARLVAHGHGYDLSSTLRNPWWREQYGAWAEADAVVVPSAHAADRLAAECGLPPERLHVVPYGVDVPTEPPPPPPPSAEVHCLAAGRLVAKKAPQVTVAAFAAAWRRRPGLRLDVIGDGPLRAEAERAAADAPVVFHGVQPHDAVLAALGNADVFLQHSVVDPDTGDEEGLPVAILEAMAAARPVVTTRHAGIPEAVEHGVTGLLVDEHDQAGMADAIAEVAADPAERRRLGQAGWERARRRYAAEAERAALAALLSG